ncbi:MAG: DUF4998 domain-containing protein [Bacteroidales bacterium]|jgi:hypothetical protein|nr:DUF4998 domain-containing protein [Bacteroidales bacterium]
MKKIHQSICAVTVSLLVLASCENMMDVHQKYLENGEIVYSPKPDSIKFYAGRNKVWFKCWTLNGVNLKSVDLYWDEDSLIIPVSLTSGRDSLMVEVPCREEKSYAFKIRTTDIFDNHSLWITGFANSYGDLFQQSLVNRSIKTFSVDGSDGTISWYPPAANLVRSEVRYTDAGQQENLLSVLPTETTLVCPGQTNNRFDVRSFFLPEAEALDTFSLAWEQTRPLYRIPRTGWSVKYCNSWQTMPSMTPGVEGPPVNVYDGNFTTIWHSRYTTYAAGNNPLDPILTRDPLPHTLVLDMGEQMDIVQVDIYRRLNNNNTQTVIAYAAVSDDALTQQDFEWLGPVSWSSNNATFFGSYVYTGVENSHWLELGRCEFSATAGATAEASMNSIDASSKNARSRYLKLVLPNGRSNGNISISEVYLSAR